MSKSSRDAAPTVDIVFECERRLSHLDVRYNQTKTFPLLILSTPVVPFSEMQ